MKLIKTSFKYKYNFKKMLDDYYKNNEKYHQKESIDIDAYIQRNIDESNGVNLKNGRVKQTEYWLIDDLNNVVGTSRLRFELSDKLKVIGGHIGYGISPSYRRNGFGKLILQYTLEEAKLNNFKDVLLTVNVDNVASRKIIESNNGVFSGTSYVDEVKKMVLRYWIKID